MHRAQILSRRLSVERDRMLSTTRERPRTRRRPKSYRERVERTRYDRYRACAATNELASGIPADAQPLHTPSSAPGREARTSETTPDQRRTCLAPAPLTLPPSQLHVAGLTPAEMRMIFQACFGSSRSDSD